MFKLLKNYLKKTSFIRSVLTLISGTTLAQLISVLISPLITRLYTPEHFGILAVFVSITSILGAVANARYELAVVLPKEDRGALKVVMLCFYLAVLFSSLVWIVILVFRARIVQLLNNDNITFWINFIPIVILLIGINNPLRFYNVRKKLYSNIAKSSIVKSVSLAVVQIVSGLAHIGVAGLIFGRFAFRIAGSFILAKPFIVDKKVSGKIQIKEVMEQARRYSKFLKYSVWARLANTVALRLNHIFISNLFSITSVGYYSLTTRVLGRPSTLLARSFGQVYYQRAVEEKHKYGHAKKTFNLTFKALLIVGIIVYVSLYFSVENIFPIVFGEKWSVAGNYAKIMMPLFFIRFVISPLSNTNSVFEKQHITLIWQSGLLSFTLLAYFLSNYFNLTINQFLFLFTFLHFMLYVILGVVVFKISRGNQNTKNDSNNKCRLNSL